MPRTSSCDVVELVPVGPRGVATDGRAKARAYLPPSPVPRPRRVLLRPPSPTRAQVDCDRDPTPPIASAILFALLTTIAIVLATLLIHP